MTQDEPLELKNPLMGLRGIARALFRELGGGEEFIRSERLGFGDQTARQDRRTQA
jgi:hypothetical protein